MAINNDICMALRGFPIRPKEYTLIGRNSVAKFFHNGREFHFELVPIGYNYYNYPLDKAEIEILEQHPTHRTLLDRFKTKKEALRRLEILLTTN